MSALLEIQKHRKTFERIELLNTVRMAMNGSKKDVERVMERWAKSAEINLTFED